MIIGLLQVRFSSSRLPGKALMEICGEALLGLQIDRVRRSKKIDKIIVITSLDPSDDTICEYCEKRNVEYFRGSLQDVLDRFYQAAKKYKPDYIVRISGDCPLHDPDVIDTAIKKCVDQYDYLCNTNPPTYPDGQDIWVFTYKTLEQTWENAKLNAEREHVCIYMKNHPDIFKVGQLISDIDHSEHRWTVDTQEDFDFVQTIYSKLYLKNKNFTTNDILQLLESDPKLQMLNNNSERDEGFQKSEFLDSIQSNKKIKQCLLLQQKAKNMIPGNNQLLSKRVDQFSEGVWPGYYKKAKGAMVWDLDNNQYLDMSIGGIGATLLGYADSEVDNAVIRSIHEGVSSSLNCPEEIELAELFCNLHPWASKVRFARTGGEAMSVAVRIARSFTQKETVALCGYHGWHDWYLAANLGSNDSLNGHLLPGLEPLGVPQSLSGTVKTFEYNKFEQLKDLSQNSDIGAIIMEPMRNSEPKDDFLKQVRELADQIGAVLIIDEITTGFRFCPGGIHLNYDLTPDIAVFAKAIGNGYASAAIIGNEEIMSAANHSFISSTNWTERIGFVSALAAIKKIVREKVYDKLTQTGLQIQEGWRKAAQKSNLDIEIGGTPPLSHFTFLNYEHEVAKAYFVQEMLKKGILASNIFYSMNSHKLWHIDYYNECTLEVFTRISEHLRNNTLQESLIGKPALSGFKRLN